MIIIIVQLDVAQVELDICKERATGHERQVREAQESLQDTKATIAARKKLVMSHSYIIQNMRPLPLICWVKMVCF